jgi:hypothetical protein
MSTNSENLSTPRYKDSGIKKAVHLAGSQTALASALGVKQQAVYHWLVSGFAPRRRAIQINDLYGIPLHDLVNPELLKFINTVHKTLI